MTNLERISTSPEELKNFLHNEFPRIAGVMKYVDFDAWCNSENKEFPFKGQKCAVNGYKGKMLLLDTSSTIFGSPYCTVINPETLDVYKVPEETVYLLKEDNESTRKEAFVYEGTKAVYL